MEVNGGEQHPAVPTLVLEGELVGVGRRQAQAPGGGEVPAETASQNIAQVGVASPIPVGDVRRIRPRVDFQLKSRDGPGSGWLTGIGGDFPFRLLSFVDVFPNARFLMGSVEKASGRNASMVGGEIGGTIRWQR